MEAGDSCFKARCLGGQGHLGSCVTLRKLLTLFGFAPSGTVKWAQS